jgi:phytoene desaturase
MQNIIIIGSGFASLAAAAVLSAEGHRVTVLEKNSTLGGRARSFQTSGFTFDMGPSWYWMPDVFESFFGKFGRHVSDYYELKRLDPAYSIYFENRLAVRIPDSPEDLHDVFESIEPGSSARLTRFLEEAAYKYKVGMQHLVHKPGRSLLEFMDYGLLKGLAKMQVFQSHHKYVRRFFKDPRLIRIMEFPVLFLGAIPENTPALYSLMNYAGLSLGTWYPMGGMYEIIKAMSDLASSLGATFHTKTEIEKIVVQDSMAQGVEANGQFYAADVVVAGADYHHVEYDLLSPEYRGYDERYWTSRTMAPSSLIFYLGISKRLQDLQHHNLFFDQDFDLHFQEIYERPQWPSRPLFYVCCPSQTDDSVAPAGCENLFILIPIAAGLQDSDAIREAYYERVLHRLEETIRQEIRSHIIFKQSYCINDFTNDYHAFRGNAYGLANTLRQTAILKPSIKSRKVENLFFTGQLTVPGPGVPPSIISGQVTGTEALKYLRNGK